jgi:hypothetical protein
MIHETEGKALLCYHKSVDGRCMHFGPACETKKGADVAEKQLKQETPPLPSKIARK